MKLTYVLSFYASMVCCPNCENRTVCSEIPLEKCKCAEWIKNYIGEEKFNKIFIEVE